MKEKQTKKMELQFYLNTIDGVKHAGCKAVGIYKGYHIERAAICPFEVFKEEMENLELMATGQYRKECEIIDRL